MTTSQWCENGTKKNNRMNHEGKKIITKKKSKNQKTIGAVKVAASPSSSLPQPVSRRQRRFTKQRTTTFFFFLLFWLKELLGMRIVVISVSRKKKKRVSISYKRNPQNGKIRTSKKKRRSAPIRLASYNNTQRVSTVAVCQSQNWHKKKNKINHRSPFNCRN